MGASDPRDWSTPPNKPLTTVRYPTLAKSPTARSKIPQLPHTEENYLRWRVEPPQRLFDSTERTPHSYERISLIFSDPTRANESTMHHTHHTILADSILSQKVPGRAREMECSVYESSFAPRVGAPISAIGCGTFEVSKQLSTLEIRPSSSRVSRSHTTIGSSCPFSFM